MDGPASEQIRDVLSWFKEDPAGAIPVERDGRSLGLLQAVTWDDARDIAALQRISRWHEAAFSWFPEPFTVTPGAARQWLAEQVLESDYRLLFWVRDVRGDYAGHVGLTDIDEDAGTVRIADIISAKSSGDGLVNAAIATLIRWCAEELNLEATAAEQRRAVAA